MHAPVFVNLHNRRLGNHSKIETVVRVAGNLSSGTQRDPTDLCPRDLILATSGLVPAPLCFKRRTLRIVAAGSTSFYMEWKRVLVLHLHCPSCWPRLAYQNPGCTRWLVQTGRSIHVLYLQLQMLSASQLRTELAEIERPSICCADCRPKIKALEEHTSKQAQVREGHLHHYVLLTVASAHLQRATAASGGQWGAEVVLSGAMDALHPTRPSPIN
jgi:hypothetical protein